MTQLGATAPFFPFQTVAWHFMDRFFSRLDLDWLLPPSYIIIFFSIHDPL